MRESSTSTQEKKLDELLEEMLIFCRSVIIKIG